MGTPEGGQFGPDGRFYVADSSRANVMVTGANGGVASVFTTGHTFSSPSDVAFNSIGELYVADQTAGGG